MFHSQELRTIHEDQEDLPACGDQAAIPEDDNPDGQRLRAEQLKALENEDEEKYSDDVRFLQAVVKARPRATAPAHASSNVSDIGSNAATVAAYLGRDSSPTADTTNNNNTRKKTRSTTGITDRRYEDDEEQQQHFKKPNKKKVRTEIDEAAVRRQKIKVICVVTVAVLIVTAIAITFVFISKKFDSQANMSTSSNQTNKTTRPTDDDGVSTPNPDDTLPYIATIIDKLSEVSDPYKLTYDPYSPQYKARVWLMEVDQQLLISGTIERMYQRYALAVLYFSTNGQDWKLPDTANDSTSFLHPDSHECTWHGIRCTTRNKLEAESAATTGTTASIENINDNNSPFEYNNNNNDDNKKVVFIDLSNSNLRGTIPSEIKLLNNLLILKLERNSLSGSLPEDAFHDLKYLYYFDVSQNQLTGSIPPSIWSSLSILRFIFLYSNSFTGPIYQQQQLSYPTKLEQVWLHDNQLMGTIPSWMNQLSNLTSLTLYNNILTGNLEQFSSVSDTTSAVGSTSPRKSKLNYLDLSTNQFTGTIPSTLLNGQYYTDLQFLYLHDNQLSGLLPNGNEPSNIKELWLQSNKLYGTIPEQFGNQWHNLTELLLQNNDRLGGTIPGCVDNENFYWRYIERLEVDCDVQRNQNPVSCTCCTVCH